MHVQTSKGCAWRGLYLYTGPKPARLHHPKGRQIARVVLDPTRDRGPLLILAVRPRARRREWEVRIPLPHVPWRFYYANRRWVPLWAYQASARFYHALDGRRRAS